MARDIRAISSSFVQSVTVDARSVGQSGAGMGRSSAVDGFENNAVQDLDIESENPIVNNNLLETDGVCEGVSPLLEDVVTSYSAPSSFIPSQESPLLSSTIRTLSVAYFEIGTMRWC